VAERNYNGRTCYAEAFDGARLTDATLHRISEGAGLAAHLFSMPTTEGTMKTEMQTIGLRRRARRIAAAAVVFLLCLLVFLILWQRRSGPAEGQTRSALPVQSASFSDGEDIPRRYTCDGADLSPNLQ
jgi:hypothetical protein